MGTVWPERAGAGEDFRPQGSPSSPALLGQGPRPSRPQAHKRARFKSRSLVCNVISPRLRWGARGVDPATTSQVCPASIVPPARRFSRGRCSALPRSHALFTLLL